MACREDEMKIQKTSGIYLLKNKGVVVYVGRSVNVRRRIWDHSDKEYDEYEVVECPVENLDDLEKSYIKRLKPKYNKAPFHNRQGKKFVYSDQEEERLNELLPVAIRLTRRMKLALSGHFRRQGMSLSVGIRTVMQEYMRANGIR